jgi:DNA-binding MarR family transcriptional regulator
MPDRPRLAFDPVDEARRQWSTHGWEEAAPAMAVVTSIMRVQQILLSRADNVLRPLGLTFARYELLMLLTFSRRGALPLGKIGERLQVNAASVTSAVDRLERDGLVARVANPSDGRGVLARLTPEGRRQADRATRAMNEEVFGDLGVEARQLEELFSALRAMRRAAGDFD